jgi:hypothetical protein
VKITHLPSGVQLVKKYARATQQQATEANRATPKTRSWVAGLALQDALVRFRIDLTSLLQPGADSVPLPRSH